jgi:hypothetical protein
VDSAEVILRMTTINIDYFVALQLIHSLSQNECPEAMLTVLVAPSFPNIFIFFVFSSGFFSCVERLSYHPL